MSMGRAAKQVRRLRFAAALFALKDQTAAAIEAGYSKKAAKSVGHKVAQHPEVQAELARLVGEARERAVLKVDEAVRLLAEQARFDLGPYLVQHQRPVLTEAGPVMVDGKPLMSTWHEIDLDKIKADGKTHLLAGVEFTDKGTLKLKLHDKHGALDRLAKLLRWAPPEEVNLNVKHDVKGLSDAELLAETEALLKKAKA